MEPPDPRVPGTTRKAEALFAFVFGSIALSLLGLLAYLADEPLIFPSLGPTAFLLFHRPTASAACPRNAIQGHLIGVCAGVAALAIFGLLSSPDALSTGVTVPRALAAGFSLGATGGLMVLLDRGHPPAGATTLIVSLGLLHQPHDLVVLMGAVAILLMLGVLVHRLAGTTYPVWGPA